MYTYWLISMRICKQLVIMLQRFVYNSIGIDDVVYPPFMGQGHRSLINIQLTKISLLHCWTLGRIIILLTYLLLLCISLSVLAKVIHL
jgi:hypothetical protein